MSFHDNPELEEKLLNGYRDRLLRIKGRGAKRARSILREHFPGIIQFESNNSYIKDIEEMPDLMSLLNNILEDVSTWNIQDALRIELDEQLNSMISIPDQGGRLVAKWIMAKSVIPEDKKQDTRVKQLDEILSIKTTTPKLSTPKKFKERVVIPQREPLEFIELDLHDLSLSDAQKTFEGTFDTYKDNNSVGAIVVVHGYGKDKSRSVIKDWLNTRYKNLKNHRRVRKIIRGERINNKFDKTTTLIRESIKDFDYLSYSNNAGISIIIFDRK